MRCLLFETAADAGKGVALHLASAIARRPALVLGLAAGRTPVPAYAELVAQAARGAVDVSHLSTVNLDEWVGVAPDDPGSFRRFMDDTLFGPLQLARASIHFLNGLAPVLDEECRRFDAQITALGGIDLQLLGIGRNGHVGFNEPADALVADTHVVELREETRRDNAGSFGGRLERVPTRALSMGIGSILRAREIVLMATGPAKAEAVDRMVSGPVTTWLPASLLQTHRRVTIYLDQAAAARLPPGCAEFVRSA